MLAETVYFDIFNNYHLMMVPLKKSVADNLIQLEIVPLR